MFLKSLIIENFRGIKKIIIENLAVPDKKNEGSGLNILVGENGCGKTTFLESIAYFKKNYHYKNQLNINDFYDYQKSISISGETNKIFLIDASGGEQNASNGFKFWALNRTKISNFSSFPRPIPSGLSFLGTYVDFDSFKIKEKGNKTNIFYFDKNRNFEKENEYFENFLGDLNWKWRTQKFDRQREEAKKFQRLIQKF